MEDESVQEGTQKEASEKQSKKTMYLVGGIGIIILILLGVYGLYKSGNDQVEEIVTPIIRIVDPSFQTPTPIPTEQPRATVSTISGFVTLNDTPPAGSSIAIGVREKDKNNYVPVVTDLRPVNGVRWSWDQAISGVTYEVQAFLLTNLDTLVSNSEISESYAPESDVELVIDYAELPAPPRGSLSISCRDESNGRWRVSYTYNINNPTSPARQYRLLAGLDTVGTLVWDETLIPPSPDTTQSTTSPYIFETGKQYFGAYAYAVCESCSEFSRVSEWVAFRCDNSSATNTPAPTSTPVPTLTKAPTKAPTKVPTKAPEAVQLPY